MSLNNRLLDMAFHSSKFEKGNNDMEIKDSGERREFETGAVRDIQKGKGRCDLMPLDVVGGIYSIYLGPNNLVTRTLSSIYSFQQAGDTCYLMDSISNFEFDSNWDDFESMFLDVAKHFEEGAKKYGESNWQKGIPARCYIDSAVRHLLKYERGDDDEPHDRAFVWNIMCCIWTCIHKPELNDYAGESSNDKK